MPAHLRKILFWCWALILFVAPHCAQAIINPSLQPRDLFERHDVVLELKVALIDAQKQTATLQVLQVIKGAFAPKTVTVSASGEDLKLAFESLAKVGSPVVAYVGGSPRKPDKILSYTGGPGEWQVGQKDARDPSIWQWTERIDPLAAGGGMAGTFNGATDRLVEMMLDKKRGHYYFPVTPQIQCREAVTICKFKSAVRGVALYDIDGDGRLDVYAASEEGDRVFLQRGNLKFEDATEALGLQNLKNPSVNFADVNADGYPDLLAGACCLAPLWRPDRLDLGVCLETKIRWLGEDAGTLRNLTGYGNEIQAGSSSMFPVIAEDLNADGLVDLYVGSRKPAQNALYLSRGYGSFTTAVSHKPDIFVGESHERGAWSLAAGDADGNGVNDLLVGCADGSLLLIPNDSLRLREPKEHPTSDQTLLAKAGILSVNVRGKHGVLGARVTLADAQGRIVGMRDLGSNIATGCRGPDTVNLAVREPGPHVLTVRFSDGKTQTRPVELRSAAHLALVVERDASTPGK